MNVAGEFDGLHNDVTERIIRVFYAVYNELGFGFVESVYKEAMRVALAEVGLRVDAEMPLSVHFHGRVIGVFRADLVVEGKVIVELKTAAKIVEAHRSQLLNYLRSTDIEVGLILNFGEEPSIKRVVMTNDRKASKLYQP